MSYRLPEWYTAEWREEEEETRRELARGEFLIFSSAREAVVALMTASSDL